MKLRNLIWNEIQRLLSIIISINCRIYCYKTLINILKSCCTLFCDSIENKLFMCYYLIILN